ncbi:hypothetical protein SpAn4DRAFT_0022 [Sporomusa ovata]|uniref:Uncharacterized protein n=1 Tax=Sporomusa ovata TaxID=2378 RepID=A0A0U1L1J9_9FIRM|nr:hypothetical protein SpAn4DRAFT_0022 [Sporomusa ovata]
MAGGTAASGFACGVLLLLPQATKLKESMISKNVVVNLSILKSPQF